MTDLIPEDVKAALKVLTDSGIEAGPGEGEEKRERKAREARNAEHQAMTVLVTHGLSLANRLVAALEEGNKRVSIAPMGEGMIAGELAKFEPAFPPELVERAVVALEAIAGQAHA